MKKIAVILIMSAMSSFAKAELKITDPTQVCSLLESIGLSTSGWKNRYSAVYGCSSPYKNIGSSDTLPNNIAFYGEGSDLSVSEAKLVININDPSSSGEAKEQLLNAARVLIPAISGADFPQSLQKAISRGKAASLKSGSTNINVKRVNWPDGNGYEIKVILD